MVEFWRSGGPGDLTPAPVARAIESAGWDGQMFMDSQSLGGDPWVLMAHWAAATDDLLLGTGTTNPLTRHPVVTAAAAATLQATSGGRAILGIGRGDSALAYLGYSPTPLPVFERVLCQLQALLSGEAIAFGSDELVGRTGSSDTLTLGDRPSEARLGWLPANLPKVPLEVAVTGPRVIRAAARVAERVTFSVGAEPDRIAWALETAESARGPAEQSYGAQVVVVVHPEPELMLAAAARMVLPLARFQVLDRGMPAGPLRAGDATEYAAILRGYEMSKHSDFEQDKLGGESVGDEFVRRFAIVGTPDECVDRLVELARLGLERFVVFGPGFHDDGTEDGTLFSTDVMPRVRAALVGRQAKVKPG